jgi:hypothetical protein
MADDLDALLEVYKDAHRKYPEERRAMEAKFMTAVVAEIKALKAAVRSITGLSDVAIAAELERIERDPDPYGTAPATTETKRKPGRPAKEAA